MSNIRVFSVSNIRELLKHMPSQRQDWILGVLSDLRNGCRNSGTLNNRLEQFYSLGVGPFRTSVSGSIHIGTEDDPIEIVRSHIEDMNPQRYRENSIFSLEQFAEIADDLTKPGQVKSNVVDTV